MVSPWEPLGREIESGQSIDQKFTFKLQKGSWKRQRFQIVKKIFVVGRILFKSPFQGGYRQLRAPWGPVATWASCCPLPTVRRGPSSCRSSVIRLISWMSFSKRLRSQSSQNSIWAQSGGPSFEQRGPTRALNNCGRLGFQKWVEQKLLPGFCRRLARC
jgi:hypothetical protein